MHHADICCYLQVLLSFLTQLITSLESFGKILWYIPWHPLGLNQKIHKRIVIASIPSNSFISMIYQIFDEISMSDMLTGLTTYIQWPLLTTNLPPANEVWGKVIFSVACVKNSVHRWGTWAGTPLGRYMPQAGTPPWAGTPLGSSTPTGRYTTPDRYTPTPRQVHTPQAGTPPGQVHPQGRYTPRAVHAGKYGQQVGGTHPTGMHSCSRIYSIQYKPIKVYFLLSQTP